MPLWSKKQPNPIAPGFVFDSEPDHAVRYTNAALRAASKGIGVWDDDACGVGPAQNTRLDMVTNFDAAGDDRFNVNGEYVQLRNRGTATVNFDNWQLSGLMAL